MTASARPVPAGLAGLSEFRPAPASPEPVATPAARAIAEAHGFVERNPPPTSPRKRRRPIEEPTYSFTARVSVRSADAFIAWCEAERMSYREAFDRLVALIPKA